jgi:hypothetical protein
MIVTHFSCGSLLLVHDLSTSPLLTLRDRKYGFDGGGRRAGEEGRGVVLELYGVAKGFNLEGVRRPLVGWGSAVPGLDLGEGAWAEIGWLRLSSILVEEAGACA